VRRPLAASFPYRYGIKFFPDLIRSHLTTARQNGWPIGVLACTVGGTLSAKESDELRNMLGIERRTRGHLQDVNLTH
jgi:hypothetical protein